MHLFELPNSNMIIMVSSILQNIKHAPDADQHAARGSS